MYNPHSVTKEFEVALCAYTGAKYAVAVNSCTAALMLAVAWHMKELTKHDYRRCIEIPKRTYVGVPMSIIHAGGVVVFEDMVWSGEYQLDPLPVFDSARRFTSGMFKKGNMHCVSFHATKILGDSQGGAILHDSAEADIWLRRARFDGRREEIDPVEDTFDMLGYHCYLSPDVAARLLWKLSALPLHNRDLMNSNYPDLSLHKAFK